MKSYKVEKHLQGRPEFLGLPYSLAWSWLGISMLLVIAAIISSSFSGYLVCGLISGGMYVGIHLLDASNFMDTVNSWVTPYPKEIQNNNIKQQAKK